MGEPRTLDVRIQFVKVTLGAGHVVALAETARVYSWGLNLLGQLGHGDTEPRWQPTLVRALQDICVTKVATGAGHSFAVDSSNTLYSWGASADF